MSTCDFPEFRTFYKLSVIQVFQKGISHHLDRIGVDKLVLASRMGDQFNVSRRYFQELCLQIQIRLTSFPSLFLLEELLRPIYTEQIEFI